jgi:hypothetical protein
MPDVGLNPVRSAPLAEGCRDLDNIDPADFVPAPGTGFNAQTDFDNFTTGALSEDTGMLAFRVVDVGDSVVDSALVLDAGTMPTAVTPRARDPHAAWSHVRQSE